MLKDNSFTLALTLSFLGHTSFVVLSLSGAAPHWFIHPTEKKAADVEVTYFEIRETPQIKEVPQWVNAPKQAPAETKSDSAKGSFQAVTVEKPVESGQVLEEETLSKEMASRLRDPVFMTYYQGIREKIRKSAKQRYQDRLA